MPVDWSDIEDALHVWLETALTGKLAASRILWSDQDMPRGEGAYVTVRRGDLVPLGQPSITEYDRTQDDPAPDAGKEIERRIEQTLQLTVSIQAFDSRMVGDVTGAALLHEAIMALSLTTVQSALETAGLYCFDRGAVRNVSELVGADFESRAVADVRFYLNDSRSEFTGYIATVELTPTIDGIDLPTQTLTLPAAEE